MKHKTCLFKHFTKTIISGNLILVSIFNWSRHVKSLALSNCDHKCLSEDSLSKEYDLAEDTNQECDSSYRLISV